MDLVHHTSPLLRVIQLDDVLQGGAQLVPGEEGGVDAGGGWRDSWLSDTNTADSDAGTSVQLARGMGLYIRTYIQMADKCTSLPAV